MSSELTFHPFANIFPLLEGAEFDALVADIKANGLYDPVVMYDGKVLDGRNRWRACQVLEISPNTVPYEGADPLAFVIAKNLKRRHLDESQRAMVAAKLATLSHGGDRKSDQAANLPVDVPTQAKPLNF
jgi:ParB-like chromosome segregation protein Spo0J